MTAVIVILVSILVVVLFVKFAKEMVGLTFILLGGLLLGIVVLFFNLDLGAKMIGWSIGLLLLQWILIGLASVVSGIVLGPIALILGGLRMFFDRLFK